MERGQVWPQARGHLRPAGTGRGKDEVPQESLPADAWVTEGDMCLHCAKPPSLWELVSAREARAWSGPRRRGCWRARGWALLGVSRTHASTYSRTAQLPSTVEV